MDLRNFTMIPQPKNIYTSRCLDCGHQEDTTFTSCPICGSNNIEFLTKKVSINYWRSWSNYIYQLNSDILSLEDFKNYYYPDWRLVNANEQPDTSFIYEADEVLSEEQMFLYEYKIRAWRMNWNSAKLPNQETIDNFVNTNNIRLTNTDPITITTLDSNSPEIYLYNNEVFIKDTANNTYKNFNRDTTQEERDAYYFDTYFYTAIYLPARLNYHQGLRCTDARALIWFGNVASMVNTLQPDLILLQQMEGEFAIINNNNYDMMLGNNSSRFQEFPAFGTIYSTIMAESRDDAASNDEWFNSINNPDKWDITKYIISSQQFPSAYLLSNLNDGIVARYQWSDEIIVTARISLDLINRMRYDNINPGSLYWMTGTHHQNRHIIEAYSVVGNGITNDWIINPAGGVWTGTTPLMHTLYLIHPDNGTKERFFTDDVHRVSLSTVNNGFLKYTYNISIDSMPDNDQETMLFTPNSIFVQIR